MRIHFSSELNRYRDLSLKGKLIAHANTRCSRLHERSTRARVARATLLLKSERTERCPKRCRAIESRQQNQNALDQHFHGVHLEGGQYMPVVIVNFAHTHTLTHNKHKYIM